MNDEWDLTDEDVAYFDKLQKNFVETKVAEYLARHTNPMIDEQQLIERFTEEYKEEMEASYTLSQRGYIALMEGLPPIYEQMELDEKETVQSEVVRWNGMLIDLGPYNEFLAKVIQAKNSLQEAFYLTNTSISCFYQVSRHYLLNKNYEKALSIFYLLVQLCPNAYEFWHGLAACYQEMGLYQEAIDAYQKAKDLFPTDATFDVFMAECYLELNQKGAAEVAIDRAKGLLGNDESSKPLKAKLRRILKKIKNLNKTTN